MSYHVAVGEVDSETIVLAALKSLDKEIGDLSALHPGSLLKGNDIGEDLNVSLELLGELAALVSVPEVCYVTVLLSLGDSVLQKYVT